MTKRDNNHVIDICPYKQSMQKSKPTNQAQNKDKRLKKLKYNWSSG